MAEAARAAAAKARAVEAAVDVVLARVVGGGRTSHCTAVVVFAECRPG